MTLPLKAKRLYIAEFDLSMAESTHINSIDEDNRRFVPDEVFETADRAREVLSELVSFYGGKGAPLVYAILLNDGRHIGHVQAYPVDDGWEIGYHIAKPFAGNGYATEAVSVFLLPIMSYLGISKICGICHADNIASRRVLEKCGFLPEFEGLAQYHGSEQRICRYKHHAEFETLEKMDDFFNARAELYDSHMLGDLGLGGFYDAINDCISKPITRLLDLGCGTGIELEHLFQRFPDMEVTGIDVSMGLLKKLEAKYPGKSLRLICGSYFDEDFEGLYDCVLSTYSLHHFSEDEKLSLYRKIHDALHSGGVFVFGDYTVSTIEEQQELLKENCIKRREQGIPDGVFYHFDTPFTPETEIRLMKEAGFAYAEIALQWDSACIIIAG